MKSILNLLVVVFVLGTAAQSSIVPKQPIENMDIKKLNTRLTELLIDLNKKYLNQELRIVHFFYVDYRGFNFANDIKSKNLIQKLRSSYYYDVEDEGSFIRTVSLIFNKNDEIVSWGDARYINLISNNEPPEIISDQVDLTRKYPDCKIYQISETHGNLFVLFDKNKMKFLKATRNGYIEISSEEYLISE